MSVPKLRFKEFDGEWHQSSLGQLTNYFKGYAFKSESYKERGVRIIRVSDLGRDSIKYDNDAIFIDEAESSDYENWMLKKHDIIITTVGSKPHLIDSAVGRPIYIKNNYEGLLNQNLLVLRPINNEIEPYFIFSQLLDNKYLTHIETIQRGNANQSNITVKDLQEFKVFSTAKTEQTKIASFLSAVDEKISLLTEKHELLSQYKQGMMQKLFSQQIRFKADDGSEFGEWENKPLKYFIINHVGGASLTPNDFVSESEYEVIPKKAITFNGKLSLDENSPTYCTKSFFEENLKNTVNKDYLITVLRDLVPSGPSIGYIVQFQSSKTYILAQGVYGFQITLNLNKDFLIHFSNTKQYRLVMKSIMVGSTQVHIRNQDFFGIEIPVPPLEEQTKIANFLSAIDQKIEVVTKQIEQVKQWKKGLLQQMFV